MFSGARTKRDFTLEHGRQAPDDASFDLLFDADRIDHQSAIDCGHDPPHPNVSVFHCHVEHHMANGMMTLLAYEGYKPTGPAAAFYPAAPAVPNHGGGGGMPPGMAMVSSSASRCFLPSSKHVIFRPACMIVSRCQAPAATVMSSAVAS